MDVHGAGCYALYISFYLGLTKFNDYYVLCLHLRGIANISHHSVQSLKSEAQSSCPARSGGSVSFASITECCKRLIVFILIMYLTFSMEFSLLVTKMNTNYDNCTWWENKAYQTLQMDHLWWGHPWIPCVPMEYISLIYTLYSPRQHRRENTSPSHGEQHVTLQQAQGSCPARKLGLMNVLWTLRFI